MEQINIKFLSEDALNYLKKNCDFIAEKIKENENNNWIYDVFPRNLFVEKKYQIEDFDLLENPDSSDKDIDFDNSIRIYEHLNILPRSVLSDRRFWLWLQFEKFYKVARTLVTIKGASTIQNMWMASQSDRRALTFGALSRMYYRVALTVDINNKDNKYELTKWIIDNPERFRNMSWSNFSSDEHLVRGVIKAEKRFVDKGNQENTDLYPKISKAVNNFGSVMLLDAISEQDIEEMIYKKITELNNQNNNQG